MAPKRKPPAKPRAPPKGALSPPGAVAFDLDGTLLDSMGLIGRVASSVMNEVFGTPLPEAERNYYRTTGRPFELQLRMLYPEATEFELLDAARKFHEAKVKKAYAQARFFPEVPKLLKTLDKAKWRLVVSTGAEREMAQVILEREGLGFFFEEVMGAQQGTKDVHFRAFHDRWPKVPLVFVGDSRFDMETGSRAKYVTVLGRACLLDGWAISPADLRSWGARWADYSLEKVPAVLEELFPSSPASAKRPKLLTGRRPSRSARVFEGGATTYSGPERKCDVGSCPESAAWVWNQAILCSKHLHEEVLSARRRNDYLRDSRATSLAPSPKIKARSAKVSGLPTSTVE